MKETTTNIRHGVAQKENWKEATKIAGYDNVSEFLRQAADEKAEIIIERSREVIPQYPQLTEECDKLLWQIRDCYTPIQVAKKWHAVYERLADVFGDLAPADNGSILMAFHEPEGSVWIQRHPYQDGAGFRFFAEGSPIALLSVVLNIMKNLVGEIRAEYEARDVRRREFYKQKEGEKWQPFLKAIKSEK